jgi:hypothetical protein
MDRSTIFFLAMRTTHDAGGTQPVTNKSVDEILRAEMNLKSLTWENIGVSAGDTCKVDKTKKSLATKLKGFSMGGELYLSENIKIDTLQKLAHYFNVKEGYRKNNKSENAIAIVLHCATMVKHKKNGTTATTNTTTTAPLKVNLCRLANVIGSPLVSARVISHSQQGCAAGEAWPGPVTDGVNYR